MARAVVESGWGLYGVKAIGMSLEDVFLKLTTTDPVSESSVSESAETEVEPAVAAQENQQ